MAIHTKLPFTHFFLVLILSYVAAVVANPAVRAELSQETTQHTGPINLQPADFSNNERLYQAYLVIQRFKRTITSDPKNITATWTGNDICSDKTYLGFHCATPPGLDGNLRVTDVIFNGFGLHSPRLQGFIDQLPDLALFHASSNNFGGDIPHLDSLPYLFEFNAANYDPQPLQPSGMYYGEGRTGGNAGFGAVPDNNGRPCSNTFLNFTFHIKVGPFGTPGRGGIIPGATDAKAVILNYNNLSGKLPANLGFSKLSYLALANNKLTGPIPQSIGQAKDSLLELLLLNNELSGCLPHELGMLTKTTVIDVGKNQLTGPIPPSFSCLTGVEQLNLGENRLYGQVPDALCKLGRLANLTLSGNYFSSVGPACSALIKDGVLDVKKNCIPGLANQRAPAECASFMSQPKASCPAASAPVSCPAAADAKKMAPEGTRVAAKDYASYVTYATLHE